MLREKPMAVGVDFDGVLVKKAAAWDIPRRASKMGLPMVESARPGLAFLNDQQDIDVLGVYTVRPEWLRRGQTKRQVNKHELKVNNVVHTSNSPLEKIRTLLDDAEGALNHRNGDRTIIHRRPQIILIDDSVEKVVEAAKELKETSPQHSNALSKFTLLAFDPNQRHSVQGLIVPGVVHVVSMQGWVRLPQALNEVRARAAA